MRYTGMVYSAGKFFSYVLLSGYIFLMAELFQPQLHDLFNEVPVEDIIKNNAKRERNRIYTLFFINTIIGAVLLVTYVANLLIKIEELKQIKKNRNEKDIKPDSTGKPDNQNT